MGTRAKQDEDKFTVPWRLVEGIASRPMLRLRDGWITDRQKRDAQGKVKKEALGQM